MCKHEKTIRGKAVQKFSFILTVFFTNIHIQFLIKMKEKTKLRPAGSAFTAERLKARSAPKHAVILKPFSENL